VHLPTYRDYFAEIKKRVKEATPQQVADLLRSGDVQLADVREKDEWDAGHLPGAVHVPKSFLEQWAEERIPDKNKATVLYCAGGVRSAMAADTLSKLGYTNIVSMSGGFNRWKDSGMAWVTPESFTPEQAQRYSRHLLIPEVGEAGQHTLLRSKVLLIGAGGLGSPAAYYLAAAGVGQLGIVDSDVVDQSNLQRQILHSTDRLGQPKALSAKQTLEALNPDVRVVPYQERLTSENIDRIIADYDVIIDGADNFPTRYLLNDASVKWNKPVVHGSIYRARHLGPRGQAAPRPGVPGVRRQPDDHRIHRLRGLLRVARRVAGRARRETGLEGLDGSGLKTTHAKIC
jgi:rhodanese-related sulfurtransferase